MLEPHSPELSLKTQAELLRIEPFSACTIARCRLRQKK